MIFWPFLIHLISSKIVKYLCAIIGSNPVLPTMHTLADAYLLDLCSSWNLKAGFLRQRSGADQVGAYFTHAGDMGTVQTFFHIRYYGSQEQHGPDSSSSCWKLAALCSLLLALTWIPSKVQGNLSLT